MTSRYRRRFVIFALATVLILAVLYVLNIQRIAGERMMRRNQLLQIGLALHNFHDVYKRFPAAAHCDDEGEPLVSWRFRILPFLEAIMRDLDLTISWDHPDQWGTDRPHHTFCFQRRSDSLDTNVVAITGPGTAFDGNEGSQLSDLDSELILAIEVADSSIPWAAPGDLPIEEVTPVVLDGIDGDGVHVLFVDGQVWYIRNSVDFEDFRAFLTVDGARKNDRQKRLGPHAPRSHHSTAAR
jgi:hypothetical protein